MAFWRGAVHLPGWALNLSRGGLRAIVEDRLDLGEELDVRIEEINVFRRGRVVWTQDEPDGTIVGISFFERLREAPSGVNFDASIEIAPGALAAKLGMTEAQLAAALEDTAPGVPRPKDVPGEDASGARPVAAVDAAPPTDRGDTK